MIPCGAKSSVSSSQDAAAASHRRRMTIRITSMISSTASASVMLLMSEVIRMFSLYRSPAPLQILRCVGQLGQGEGSPSQDAVSVPSCHHEHQQYPQVPPRRMSRPTSGSRNLRGAGGSKRS